MEDKNDIVRIIESESNEIETKMLWFQFPTENDLKALFLPKLENIGFILVGNTITLYQIEGYNLAGLAAQRHLCVSARCASTQC